MKTKTINIILCRLFDKWRNSIEDEGLRELVHRNTLITGGAITSMLLGEPVNDYDMYFKNKETALAVAKYYVEKFKSNSPPRFKEGKAVEIWAEAQEDRVKIIVKSAGIASETQTEPYRYFETSAGTPLDFNDLEAGEYIEGTMDVLMAEAEGGTAFRPVFMSSNAITLSDRVQLIIRFFGKPEEVHQNFDFVHCMNYWDSKTRMVILNQNALEATLTRELRYVGSLYPLCSVIRTRKFIQRGWTVNAGQYLKMIMQLQKLDLTDINVLEDQLVGVDAAYFIEVIAKLRENDPEKVNLAYLIALIDRIF